MYDRALAMDILRQIHGAAQTILERFATVGAVKDLTDTPSGKEKLDSICMQLIAIGENLKNFDKVTDKAILPRYSQIDWKKVKGMRDIISHHYFEVDAEVIFHVCDNYIDPMAQTIKQMMKELA